MGLEHQDVRALLAALAVVGACASPVTTTGNTPAAVAHCRSVGGLPDKTCTPGVTDPAVTQSNIGQTICHAGYTATVRPPASYTDALKRRQMAEYGEAGPPSGFEEDHLIPLELGGAPKDPANLWPEPGGSPNPKDTVEGTLHWQVCAGQVTLVAAQQRIASDWKTALTIHM